MMGQTDGQTLGHFTDLAVHTMHASSFNNVGPGAIHVIQTTEWKHQMKRLKNIFQYHATILHGNKSVFIK